jgi:uncharacterized membrane protein YdjX (TVP38/TMEM64 family)
MTDNSQKNRPNKKNGQIKLGARFYILICILVLFIGLLFIIPDVRAFIERLWHVMKNPDDLQQYIREEGKWAPLVFIFVQILQVIIAPIPGNVTTLVGGLLFGYTLGFIYGATGLIIGSSLAFGLARYYGKPVIIRFAGMERYEKYSRLFTKKGRVLLFMLFLMPFFPDDILCLIAGVSSMTYWNFLLFVIFGRLPGVFVTVFIGSGSLKLPVFAWVLLGLGTGVVLYFSARYGEKIEDFLLTKLKKLSKSDLKGD